MFLRAPITIGFSALVLSLTAAAPAWSTQQAGISAAVRGEVERASDAQPVGVQISSGQPIYLQDRITSGRNSGMQIMLLDQTTFTIGPDSFVKIDEFVYDPNTNVGKVTASLGKGVFRFVTGKIAQQNPSNMTVKLPVATIGIRGTMVFGRSDENSAVVGLAGPGRDNNTNDKAAGVDVITPQGTVELRRPGWGALIERGRPPVVEQLPKPTVDAILAAVAPRDTLASFTAAASTAGAAQNQGQSGPAVGTANAGSANAASGQSTASALPTIGTFNTVQQTGQNADNQGRQATLNGGGSSSGINDPEAFIDTLFGNFFQSPITTFADLNSVVSGTGTYTQSNVPIFNATGVGASTIGTYNFGATVNFDTHIFNANFSNININGGGLSVANGILSIGPQFFNDPASPSSAAIFSASSATCGGNANCQGYVLFNNAGGVAGNALHELLVTPTGSSTIAAVGAGVAPKQ